MGWGEGDGGGGGDGGDGCIPVWKIVRYYFLGKN